MEPNATQQTIYHQRIDTVIAYVRTHLEEDLSLETLAAVAGFSPFHFHRLFKAITNETINELTNRLRLERAAALLRAIPTLSITDAAFACGFNSIAVFSRAFKKRYGIPASQWDRQQPLKNSKIGQLSEAFPRYTLENLSEWANAGCLQVQQRALPAQRLAYIRVYDSYSHYERITQAYEQLLTWYEQRGGRLADTTLYGMSQDDPEITPRALCRFDWCLSVPTDWIAEGAVNVVDFSACQVAAIHCHGDIYQEDRALQFLFRYWLPRSKYQPANLPTMEIYRRQPVELGWEIYDMDCAVPIELL
ncbi:MAG: AraC family transcriptional regulator [Caldilineaceae bacterium]|nr:AraC family transcriptional regulator [Caldilineaceae bacterium]